MSTNKNRWFLIAAVAFALVITMLAVTFIMPEQTNRGKKRKLYVL